LGGDVFNIFGGQHAAARIGRMLDRVVDQAHVAIDEVIPGAGLLPQATIDEVAVNVAQGHSAASSRRRRRKLGWESLPMVESRQNLLKFYHNTASRQPALRDLCRLLLSLHPRRSLGVDECIVGTRSKGR